MTLSMTFSKPSKDAGDRLDRPYIKIRVWRRAGAGLAAPAGGSSGALPVYDAEFFTDKQSFRRTFTEQELEEFKREHVGKTFRSVVERTEEAEITTLANKRGESRTFSRPVRNPAPPSFAEKADHKKKYIMEEGSPVPFLIHQGVMTREGKIVAQKQDKFRQINRFLEYVDDILDRIGCGEFSPDKPLRVVDFGCGKSYLTFAVYHFLTAIRHIPADITGLDLKADVIADCQKLAVESSYENLHFQVGNIADYPDGRTPDIVITLHACDKATDYALDWAVRQGAKAVLCVPCCQHEVNLQLQEKASMPDSSPFACLVRHGLVRERFAALVTDAIRGELLEQAGYNVQMLEFIDMSHTPKNLLIRAVKKRQADIASPDGQKSASRSTARKSALLDALGVAQELDRLMAQAVSQP